MRKILACGIAGALLLGTPSKGRCGGSGVDVEDVGFAAAGLGLGSQGVAGVRSLNFSHRDFFNVFAELRPHGSFAGVVLMLQAGKLR
jgi:hypothetical protein